MRIAVITETFLPKVDGIVRMLTEFLDYLGHTTHEALVVAPGSGPTSYSRFPVVRLPGLRWRPYPGLTIARPAPRLIETIGNWQPDIIHLAGPAILGAQGALAGRALGVPIAAHFQTDLASYAASRGFGALKPVVWRYLRALHGLAARTYCPTPAVARQLSGHGFRDLTLCARGVNTRLFTPDCRDAAYRAAAIGGSPAHETPILTYVGRLAPEKNLAALVALAGHRPDLPLVIVGDGPERAWLEGALAGTKARFTGELHGAELAAAYASADIFVVPSQTETYCQAAQEAMASGVPVVGFRAGGISDVVLHGKTGLLSDANTTGAWLSAIDALVAAPAWRNQLGANAREVAASRTWTAVFERLIDEYAEIVRTHRRSAPARTWRDNRWARRLVGRGAGPRLVQPVGPSR